MAIFFVPISGLGPMCLALTLAFKSGNVIGPGQYHLAVAGGSTIRFKKHLRIGSFYFLPTRYREVVLTWSKSGSDF